LEQRRRHRGSRRQSNGDETFTGGAKITATFGTLSYDPKQKSGDTQPTPAPYVTESRSTGGQTITLSKKNADGSAAWRWFGTTTKLTEDAPDILKVQALGHYTLTKHSVAVYPKDTINGLIGAVNSGAFPQSSSAGGYAAEQLLFLGDDSEREFLSDGSTKAWTIALKFAYNPNGWNKLYRPDTGTYTRIVNVTSNDYPFTVSDFSTLLA
jgi:hypothetical protein